MVRTKSEASRPRGEATRAEIVDAARRLFSEHGYHNTGIADIQEATGLTKGAFYHHFRSKEDLALAVLEAARADYDEHLIGPAMQQASSAERIEALLDGAIALNARPEWSNCQMMATLCAELTAGDGRLREAVRDIQLGFFELWRDLFAEAQQAGQADGQIEPATAAQWVTNTLAGSLLARKLGTAQVNPEALITLMKRTLLKKPARARTPDATRGK